MLQQDWHFKKIDTMEDAKEMLALFDEQQPEVGGFDTETTGLHIKADKPFLFQWGWLYGSHGYAFVLELRKDAVLTKFVLDEWHIRAHRLRTYLAHNIKFDLHMLTNIGYGDKFPRHNLSDTMFYIRYSHDALAPKNGGPPLKLKEYAAKYIDISAKDFERLLAEERTAVCKAYREDLRKRMRLAGLQKLADLDAMFKDPIFDVADLPTPLFEAYCGWVKSLPKYLRDRATRRMLTSDDIRYDTLNRNNLIRYSFLDIVYLLEIYLKCKPVLYAREQDVALKFENDVIIPLYEMERTGFLVDKEYIEASRKRLKAYIQKKRERLKELAQTDVKVGQHALIKKLIQEYFGYGEISSTGTAVLDKELAILKRNPEENAGLIEFISLIELLRTLEKWYSTYIIRFQDALARDDRLYTMIHQVGTVSGRVTSDFQQFPKEAIIDEDGNELFHPRRIVLAPKGGKLVYIDYAACELRITAEYTILVGHPDKNLCRAYFPFLCQERDGKFYLEEDPEVEWQPTDLHSATAKELFPGHSPTDKDWKHWRSIAKTYNFAKNYGGGYAVTANMFAGESEAEIKQKDGAYYRTFPGIKAYHDYCYRLMETQSYCMNLFGVKYYGVSGFKAINILGQGTGAFLLKWKIKQLYEYMKRHPEIKARYQMNVHDENSWEDPDGDTPYEVFLEMKHIMEDYPECHIPFVAEMAVSYKSWADKKDVHTKEEFINAGLGT